jgi:hypothetical protein
MVRAMSTGSELKMLHDQLLATKPEGEDHDCPLCAMESVSHDSTGGFMPETFTQADLDAAIAASNASLQQRLAELVAQVQESEVGKAVAAVTAEKDTEISKLQEQLDAAEAARTAAEAKHAEVEQFWSEAIAEHEEAAELAARRAERVETAKKAGVLSEDYIEKNADRFAAMSAEDFNARIDEWRLIASQTRGNSTAPIPSSTALVAARQEDASTGSQLGLITALRSKGVDPRTLIGGV